jgi:DNA-binding response OmpR family regulator
MRLLVIEDSTDILANLVDYLSLAGHVVDSASDGLTGMHLAATQSYDLIVLDIMLPGLDGLTLCQRLRESERSDVPIVMLTARESLEHRLRGFAAGADDYLPKPFAMAELAARIEAVLRRSRGGGQRVLAVGDLRYDLDTLVVERAGRQLRIGPIGLKLLGELMRRSPAVMTREALEAAVWGDSPPDSDSLRRHMHQLRHQVDKGFGRPLLHTVHGIGYRLAHA